jgi:hypothetical protein
VEDRLQNEIITRAFVVPLYPYILSIVHNPSELSRACIDSFSPGPSHHHIFIFHLQLKNLLSLLDEVFGQRDQSHWINQMVI